MGKISAATITKRTARHFDTYLGGVAYNARHVFEAWVKPFLKRRKLSLHVRAHKNGKGGSWYVVDGSGDAVMEHGFGSADNPKLDADLRWMASILEAKVEGCEACFGAFLPSYYSYSDTVIEHD